MAESLDQKKKRIGRIIQRFRCKDPRPRCPLNFSTPLELLVATILSAQCTDKRVNEVTPALFKKYRSAKDYATSDLRALEEAIRSTGFYKNKARSIREAAKVIHERFGGHVPDRLDDLVGLPGVGRKTANVVLGNAYQQPALMVDTHMIRVNRRLGLTDHTDPVKIEFDLMACVPRKYWTPYSLWIIQHGRTRCQARRPDCPACELKDLCPSARNSSHG